MLNLKNLLRKNINAHALVSQRTRAAQVSFLAFLTMSATSALAGDPAYEKVALIIGNSDYVEMPDLPNAINDAAAVSKMLEDSGYLVIEKQDLTKQEFSETIAQISTNLNSSSEVVFFFAGHGFQIGSENYLIPTNSQISDLTDIPLESISLTHVLEHFSTLSGSQVVLLDSCRNNPFIGQQAYNGLGTEQLKIENGFSFQSAPVNSLISFSTAPGSVALDGEGENSPYTTSLINATAMFPDYDIASILPIMRAQVFEETQGFQVPWESSSLLKPVYLSKRPDDVIGDQLVVEPARQNVQVSQAQTAPDAASSIQIALTGHVEKHVPIFAQNDTRGLSLASDLVVSTVPENGWLGIVNGDSVRRVGMGDSVGASEVAHLTYSPDVSANLRTRGLRPVVDFVELRRGGNNVSVQINLDYHACDLAAASPQDSQGLGLAVENFNLDPDKALPACLQAVEEFPTVGRFFYQLARAHIAKQQFDAAQSAMETARDLGHIRAHAGLGQVQLTQTRGIAADNTRRKQDAIIQHYVDGHQVGDILATYLLGRHLIRHGDTPADRQSGFRLLHRAKDAGHVEALNELGRYFLVSKTGDANPQRGLQYFEESAQRGNNQGHNSLGMIYKNGLGGLDTDFTKAVANFEAAASLKHPTAPTSLGRVWSEGVLVQPDFSKALEWYDAGLSRGDPWGGTNGANLIILGKIPGTDTTQAAVRLAKAVAIGASDAQRAAADMQKGLSKKELSLGLQRLLRDMGQDVTVDGNPGPQTERAVINVYGALVRLESAEDIAHATNKVAEVFWERAGLRRDLN